MRFPAVRLVLGTARLGTLAEEPGYARFPAAKTRS
jgi:hypothetical protein